MQHETEEHTAEGLTESGLLATPYAQVAGWVADAVRRSESGPDVVEPFAMAVATTDAEGRPNVRTVIMRFLDERGPGFVTSTTSRKGRELAVNPAVAATLTWPAMYRAVRFRGHAAPLDPHEVEAYWRSRPWASRISAWASRQSEPVGSRAELEAEYARRAAQFPDGGGEVDVPVPESWGGYRILCDEVELWAGRRDRLHDRIVYTRTGHGDLGDAASWQVHRRQP
jgi:pyridoxamine 5'-phosphate oxidase